MSIVPDGHGGGHHRDGGRRARRRHLHALPLPVVRSLGVRSAARAVHPAPGEMWKYLPALFGMPVEYETSILARLPWMTWLVAALATGVSVAGFVNLDSAVKQYAL